MDKSSYSKQGISGALAVQAVIVLGTQATVFVLDQGGPTSFTQKIEVDLWILGAKKRRSSAPKKYFCFCF